MTQAVGYISGRSGVLCATFILAALLIARRALVSGRRVWLMAAIACWAVALAAKEPAVMFPVLLLAYDIVVLRGDAAERRTRLWRMHLPLLATTAALIAIRLAVFIAIEHRGDVSLQWTFALVELDVIRRYMSMLLVPTGQAIFHAVTPIGPGDAAALGGVVVVGLMAALIWLRRRRAPLASFGLLWFLLMLGPSSVLVVLDRGEPMAEHRVYLASIGVFLTAGVAAGQVAAVKPSGFMRTLGVMTMAALTLSLAGRTVLRNQLWASPTLVWLEATEQAPDHWLPALLLGEELHRTGRHVEAVVAFRRAVAARPESRSALGNLGVCLLEQGDGASAEQAFAAQKTLDPRSPEASNGLATVALARGAVDEARRGFLETLSFDPPNLAARRGLAVIAETVDRNPGEALRWCREIAAIAPGTPGSAECVSRNSAPASTNGGSDGVR
jgi:Flp pilus assembly protein TadD